MTPQLRAKVIRKIGNLFPDCDVMFVSSTDRHFKFRLVDRAGRERSGLITMMLSEESLRGQRVKEMVLGSCGRGIIPPGERS